MKRSAGRGRGFPLACWLALAMGTIGCFQSAETPVAQSPSGSCNDNAGAAGAHLADTGATTTTSGEVTWSKDILPMLKSASGGRNYRCVYCHRNYNDYDSVIEKETFTALVASVVSKKMPVSGDEVSAADIKRLKAWESAGFPKDPKPAAAMANRSNAAGTAGTASGPCKPKP